MMMRKWMQGLLIAAGVAGLSGSAWAGQDFTVYGVSQESNAVAVQLNAPVSVGTWAGPILLNTSIGNLVTWCIDVYAEINLGGGQNLSYQTGNVSTATNNGNGVDLTSSQVQEIQGLVGYGNTLFNNNPNDADSLAAVQLAIWSVEYAGFSYSGGDATVTSDTAADIANAPNLSAYATQLTSLSGTQNLVTASIPEPVSLTLLGSGLLALGCARRRRRS